MIPLRQTSQRVSEFPKPTRQPRLLPKFRARLDLILKLITKKSPPPTTKILQKPSPRPQQIHSARQPSMPVARTPLVAPKPIHPQLPFHMRQQFLNRHLRQILRVKPLELRPVKHRISPANPTKRKSPHQFRSRQIFRIVPGRPAQKSQKIPKSLRQKSFLHIRSNGSSPMPLRKPRPIRPKNQRHMSKNRRRSPQSEINQNLLRRIRKMIRPADHVSNAHVNVINHDTELISRQSIRPQQNKILDLRILNFARSKNRILKLSYARPRHQTTNCRRLAGTLLSRPRLKR